MRFEVPRPRAWRESLKHIARAGSSSCAPTWMTSRRSLEDSVTLSCSSVSARENQDLAFGTHQAVLAMLVFSPSRGQRDQMSCSAALAADSMNELLVVVALQ